MIPTSLKEIAGVPEPAVFKRRTLQELLDETKDQMRYVHRSWEEVKIRAACNGTATSSVDDEMTRTEHGRVHLWDTDMRHYSLAAIHGPIGCKGMNDGD